MAGVRYGNPEAVVLDLSGVAAMFQQQQQQKRLVQQQLDKQINDDLSKLSFEGVRPQDYQAIRQRYDAYRDAAINYKKALRDPRMRDQAEQEYINSKSELNTAVGKSKSRKEAVKGVIDFWGKNRDQIDPTEFAKTKSLLDAPLGTKEFDDADGIDVTSLVFKPDQYDPKKLSDLIGTIKPVENNVTTQLPNGQFSYVNKKIIPPNTLAGLVGDAYENDYANTKKYFDSKFNTLPPEERSIYEDYAKQYIPDFAINSPKDLAIAQNMYGRLDVGSEQGIKGRDVSRAEKFAMEQQARQIAAVNRRQNIWLQSQKDNRDKEDYFVVDDIARNMVAGNAAAALAPFQSNISPGTEVRYVKDGDPWLESLYKDLKKGGVDAYTRKLSKEAFKKGTIIVAVPKIDPETKEPIKDHYEIMAVSASDKAPQSRINAALNYARGGTIKPLPDKYYKDRLSNPQTGLMNMPGYFNPDNEDEEN